MRLKRVWLLVLLAAQGFAAPTVLYDATSGDTPGTSGWVAFAPGATEFMGPGYVDFSTLALNALQGGYTRSAALGDSFRLRVDLAMVAESHASDDRAGFSIIALDTASRGVELSFWTDEVWVQNTGFTHGEGVAYDTTAAMARYDLFIGGGSYRVEINGVEQLSGAMRDYSSFGAPYNIPNFLFLGDDTTSAAGRVRLALVEFEHVPEPTALTLAAVGMALLLLGRVRRGRAGGRQAPEVQIEPPQNVRRRAI